MQISPRALLLAACAAVLCWAAAGCTPRLVVRTPRLIAYAAAGPEVRVLPIIDQRANPLQVGIGYAGLFQSRQDDNTGAETAPALVVGEALGAELLRRGHSAPQLGRFEVGCTMPGFLLRYRNYAGAYSATDGWGYLDLVCQVRGGGQVVWEGPVHARTHRVYYVLFQSFPDAVWPELAGALVQQAAAILNRQVFHLPAAPALVQEATRDLASADADKRYGGAYALGVTGDPGVVPLLLQHLSDPDKKVRRSVVDALGTLGAREVLPALLQRFDGEDGNVQWATIKAVLQIGDPQAFAWLRARAPALTADTLKEIATDVLALEGR